MAGCQYKQFRLMKSTWGPVFSALSMVVIIGCSSNEVKQKEIREKVESARYEEALDLAHEYFKNDKSLLLASLAYICEHKDRDLKEAYRSRLRIDHYDWWKDRYGFIRVIGRIINGGGKNISGFAVKIEFLQTGTVIHTSTLTEIKLINAGAFREFEYRKSAPENCDQVKVELTEFAFKD